jgi:hypothetical protein
MIEVVDAFKHIFDVVLDDPVAFEDLDEAIVESIFVEGSAALVLKVDVDDFAHLLLLSVYNT